MDKSIFRQALKNRGYHSIGELAKTLSIHRNTIHHYLSDQNILPTNFEKIIRELDLKPEEILVDASRLKPSPFEDIAPLVDQLHLEFPHMAYVLFGSRAQRKARKYSDWDLGIFSRQGLTHKIYRNMISRKEELVQNLPFFVDLVNLNRADTQFLKNISKHWVFLTGSLTDWIELQRKTAL